MRLENLTGPADLRGLSKAELIELAAEIRTFIVESVGRSGGHLGSNLGVVEVTLAIHRTFDSPHDIILWDTGHQAYVHKLVTGRSAGFDELRQAGGLSGYPSRAESAHDWIENSHASTVLSYAHGLAMAMRVGNVGPRRIVAVIGDGSMTGGLAFEGLNNLGHSGADVTIVLNDNGRSYAPTVSKLTDSLVRIRSNPVYMQRQARMEKLAENIPWLGERLERGINATKWAIRHMWEPPAFFEHLGVRYMGPFDGHDVEAVEGALRNARRFDGPVVVHVLTQKGRGHAPAENDHIKNMHDTSELKPGSFTAAFSEAMVKMGEEHPNVVAITAAMPDSTGLLPFQERFPDRCFDVGIAEQHAVTAAAGMAMGGLRPVVAVYSTFLSRAFDQVNLDVGLHGQPVVFALDRAGITGDDGASHHGLLDMVLLSKVPGMTIFAPSSYQELQVMLADALTLDGPASIRWSKTAARSVAEGHTGHGLRARRTRVGAEVCILAVGQLLEAAEKAADRLAATGVTTSVWDVRVVTPLDAEMIADAATHPLVVTIEDGLRAGGAGEAMREQINRANGDVDVRVLGVPTQYVPHGKPAAILAGFGLDADGIVATVESARNATAVTPRRS
jgi:1-deoxy-D-xylulose-5-phosphate synthase